MNAIYWLTAQLAAEGPLVLTVDDAHWADASSLRALDFLARRLIDLPAVLILALRPEEPGARVDLLDELRDVAKGRVSLKLSSRPRWRASFATRFRMRATRSVTPAMRPRLGTRCTSGSCCTPSDAGDPALMAPQSPSLRADPWRPGNSPCRPGRRRRPGPGEAMAVLGTGLGSRLRPRCHR